MTNTELILMQFGNVIAGRLELPHEGELAHYGVLGMRWGIRKDRGGSGKGSSKGKGGSSSKEKTDAQKAKATAKAEKAAAKQEAKEVKQDQKWMNNKLTSIYIDAHNYAAERMNGEILDKFNDKWTVEQIQKTPDKYYNAYSELTAKYMNEGLSRNNSGSSPSGRVELVIRPATDGSAGVYYEFQESKRAKHADEDDEYSVEEMLAYARDILEGSAPEIDEDGRVILKKITSEDLLHALLAFSEILDEENVLVHYGVIGMKWGVRKDRNAERRSERRAARETKRRTAIMRSPSRLNRNLDKFSQSEIDSAMRRLRLERELRSLTRDELSSGRTLAQVALDYGKTAVAFYGLYNSTAGRSVRNWFKNRG